ncbi:C39 family peptidase [Gimesia aquarii]|uniref:Peptidase C39-like domain-containing protein n=1 Tax=Gimesia aquarii TaxID=2527964 RepID=A0A517X0M2_9PLAN|nr:C39 family peptidase [Gimesia aquarii]QDU11049.1 hypothetical protein V202x_44650 [Gimesia aquarii]
MFVRFVMVIAFVVLNPLVERSFAQQEVAVDHAVAPGNRQTVKPVKSDVFLKIKHIRQKEKLCATASASMALSHYGVEMDQVLIKQLAASVSKNPQFVGTYYVDLVNGLAKKGIHWKRNPHPTTSKGFRTGLKTIRESLFAGCPVLIDTNLAPNGHTMLVNGIDPRRRLISVIDPNRPAPGQRKYTYNQFEKIWRSKTVNVRGSILTFPPEKKSGQNENKKSS